MKEQNNLSTGGILAKLKQLRKNRNLSQATLASKIHVSKSAYCKIEKGQIELTLSRLNCILEVLDVSMEQFLEKPQTPNFWENNSTPILSHIDVKIPSAALQMYGLPASNHLSVEVLNELLQQTNKRLTKIEEKMQDVLDLLMSQTFNMKQTQAILGGISYNTVRKLIVNGHLEQVANEQGGRILITSKSIHAYINNTDKRRQDE